MALRCGKLVVLREPGEEWVVSTSSTSKDLFRAAGKRENTKRHQPHDYFCKFKQCFAPVNRGQRLTAHRFSITVTYFPFAIFNINNLWVKAAVCREEKTIS